jgi:hypothetical protein
MFGLPVTLIFYVVAAIAVVGGGWGVIHAHDAKVKTAALAPWKPLTDKCEATKLNAAACAGQWALAVDSNLSLQNDVYGPQGWAKKVDACNAGNERLAKEQARALDRAAKAEAVNRAGKQRAAAGAEAQLARLQSKPQGVTCEQIISDVGANLIKVGKDQLKDAEPAKAPETIKVR